MGVHDMEVCSSGHPPIAHTEGYKNCPLCKALDESEVVSLENRIMELEGDIVDLRNEKGTLEYLLRKAQAEKHPES